MSKLNRLLVHASTLAITAGLTGAAFAQSTPAPPPSVSTVEEVVVTGSLVVRNGNEAPTPVTVVDTATLQQSAPTNIPDGLNQLPQFSGSRTQTGSNSSAPSLGATTGNYLNLRNLGFNRSLILVDGMRVAPTSFEGTVDVNVLPQALVQRVDVVTAGASATYGSDAVTGVVNFILDKKYKGLKGSVQYGVSQEGDNANYRVTLAGGAGLLDGRAHGLFSLERFRADGIPDRNDRPFWGKQPCTYGNGTTVPYRIEFGCGQYLSSYGGTIQDGPLARMKFNPDGTLSPHNVGTLPTFNSHQVGGDGSHAGGQLAASLDTDQAFARLSYDLTPDITVFVQAAFGESRTRTVQNSVDNNLANITVYSGNAFLRPEQQAVLTANNTASFKLSRQGTEQGGRVVDSLNDSVNVFAGFNGKVFGDWDWRVSYSGGNSIVRVGHTLNGETAKFSAAIDAVVDPATGKIVCRVTLTNPTTLPGCVPLNIFGQNRASPEAIAYVFGQDSQFQVRSQQHDVAGTISGSLWELPAGTLNVAGGAEWRTAAMQMYSNADPATFTPELPGIRGVPGGFGKFHNTNQGEADGEQDVWEVFGEALVPLIKDMSLIKALDFNGAYRVTNYATSGQVSTWKAGLNYQPINDLRVRATISQDIRAPSLNELFAGTRLSGGLFVDIHTNSSGYIASETSGNADLEPEVGKTATFGFVYQPTWLSGFSASLDYYNIEIEGAIASRSSTQIVQDCEDSNGTLPGCAFIIRPFPFSNRTPANVPTRILSKPQNLSLAYTHGLDLDAGYRLPLDLLFPDGDGALTFRFLANYAPSYKTQETPTAPIRQQNGTPTSPALRTTATINLQAGAWRFNLQQRYIGAVKRSVDPAIKYEDNDIPGWNYFNLSGSYRFPVRSGYLEAFGNINNLFNKQPPLIPVITQIGLGYPTAQNTYDVVGRTYTLGLRFNF